MTGITSTEPAVRVREEALVESVRRYVTTLLPPGVVPSRFVVLDDFPRLPNGKTDRSKLPEPTTTAAALSTRRGHTSPETHVERTIASIWREVLGHDMTDLDVDTSFNDLGGSSLSMMQMAARVKAAVGQGVDVRRFMAAPTIRALAADLGGVAVTTAAPQLHNADERTMRADAELPSDIRPDSNRDVSAPCRHVLLTGGTGYTGAFLLRELLDRGSARITVLARGAGPDDVVRRTLRNLDSYDLAGSRDDEDRLTGVVGDVSRPYLDLHPEDYEQVARDADVIIHNAADSRWTISYAEAKITNVLGTLEVLRLAQRGGNTPIHYVGSTGSLPTKPGSPTWAEDEIDDLEGVLGGYRQSKWVSDRLMHQARRRGMRVSVYRPGALVGSQVTGTCSTDTFINHLIRGWIGLGAAMSYDLQVELVPIDYCARVVAHLALQRPEPATYHVLGTKPVMLKDFLEHLLAYGYSLDVLSYPQWYERLLEAANRGEENDLVPYLPLFSPEAPGLEIGLTGNYPRFLDSELTGALGDSGITQEPFSRKVMFTYLDYFVKTGFLPPPTQSRAPLSESEPQP